MTDLAQIGVTGLAVMGRNLARNLARHGHTVALHNRSPEKTKALVEEFGHEGKFLPAESAEQFVASLERPRRVMIMVKAGGPTDAVIEEFAPLLEPGDMIIDGGNAHFADTRRREASLRERGLHFVGAGVSGGEEGALNGPSIMPGGSPESYEALGPLLEDISAKVDGVPCCVHVGPDGAGHFVKMVHNGIEYSDMQLIAEAYDLLRHGAGMEPAAIADVFRQWNTGRLSSYLIEITAEVLAHTDADGKPFVDTVVDQAEQKGTGRWTVQIALDLGVPVSGIAEAVFARSLSGSAVPGRRRGTGAVRLQDRRVRAGLQPDPGRQRRVRLGHRPGRDGHHLARRLHHPGRVPGQDPGSLRREQATAEPAGGRLLQGRDGGRAGVLAQGRRDRCPARHPRPRIRHRAGLLRRPAGRAPAGRARTGSAGLLRGPHLPAGGPRRHLPHHVGRRPARGSQLSARTGGQGRIAVAAAVRP
jgi:6-phosphogluconate dehydrogenase (decarboxylating)